MILPVNSMVRKLLVTMSLVVAGLVFGLGGFEIVQDTEAKVKAEALEC